MTIANAEKIKTDIDSMLNGGAVLIDESPILMAATHIETFIHLRKVRSLAKNSLGSTFLAPSSLKADLVFVLPARPPKIRKRVRERGLGSIDRGMLLSDCGFFTGETPWTLIVDTNIKWNVWEDPTTFVFTKKGEPTMSKSCLSIGRKIHFHLVPSFFVVVLLLLLPRMFDCHFDWIQIRLTIFLLTGLGRNSSSEFPSPFNSITSTLSPSSRTASETPGDRSTK